MWATIPSARPRNAGSTGSVRRKRWISSSRVSGSTPAVTSSREQQLDVVRYAEQQTELGFHAVQPASNAPTRLPAGSRKRSSRALRPLGPPGGVSRATNATVCPDGEFGIDWLARPARSLTPHCRCRDAFCTYRPAARTAHPAPPCVRLWTITGFPPSRVVLPAPFAPSKPREPRLGARRKEIGPQPQPGEPPEPVDRRRGLQAGAAASFPALPAGVVRDKASTKAAASPETVRVPAQYIRAGATGTPARTPTARTASPSGAAGRPPGRQCDRGELQHAVNQQESQLARRAPRSTVPRSSRTGSLLVTTTA